MGILDASTDITWSDLDATYALKPDNGARAVGQGELVLNVRNFGAKGDGVTDDTAAIQAANNAAATGDQSVFFPKGTYLANVLTISAPLFGVGVKSVLNAKTLAISAGNVTLRDLKVQSRSSTAINAAHVSDLRLRDVEVSHDSGLNNHLALNAYDVQRLSVTGCKFGIGGLQLSFSTDFHISSNIWDSQYLNTNEQLHVSGQSSGTVVGNSFLNTLDNFIDLYSAGHYCAIVGNRMIGCKSAAGIECKVTMSTDPGNTSGPGNVFEATVIANNVLRDFIPTSTGTRVGIYAEYVDNRATRAFSSAETNRAIIISNNVLENFNVNDPGTGIIGSYRGIAYTGHNGIISGNVVRNMRAWHGAIPIGIQMAAPAGTKCSGVRVAGNVIAGVENYAGIEVGSLDRCQIDGNLIRRDDVSGVETKYGVGLAAAAVLNHCTIIGNTFECNVATGLGLRAAASTARLNRCLLQGNIFKDCGVSVPVAQYCTFGNNILETNHQGFSVGTPGTSCRGNVYSGNHITTGDNYGLVLTDHDGLVVAGNSFNNTRRAVLMRGASRHGIFDNNVSITQTLGAEFPYYSGVSPVDRATNSIGSNKVL